MTNGQGQFLERSGHPSTPFDTGSYTPGTIRYGYDANSNLTSKIAPLPNQPSTSLTATTTMGYDQLNRLRTKSYSDGMTPTSTTNYDEGSALGVSGLLNTIGRESSATMSGSQSGEVFSYDELGRTKANSQCTPQNCSAGTIFPITYTYDLLGDMTSSTNGEGVTLSYAVNRAPRLTTLTSSLSDSNHPGTLYSSLHYNAAGSVTSASFGDSGSNVAETRSYDGRLRLSTITDGSLYSVSIPTAGGYAPNGDILQAIDSVNFTWSYAYDPLNRLCAANQSSTQPVCGTGLYTWAYDRFGNRWQQNGSYGIALTFSGNNNHMDPGTAGYAYDAAGNLTNDGNSTYTYDSENRIISAYNSTTGTSNYLYDADGRRIRKTTVANGAVDYLYDLAGHEISEVSSAGGWNRGEVYAASRHIATYNGGTTYFNFADWLGTERARSTGGGVAYETCTSLPFGDALGCSSSDSSPMHFTGKQRDYESGLDDFGARYDSSSLGRFMTPDWSAKTEPVPYAKLDSPESLNLYAYVQDNPVTSTDPDGHWCLFHWGGTCTVDQKNDLVPQAQNKSTQQGSGTNTTARAVEAGEAATNFALAKVKLSAAVGTATTAETGVGAVAAAYLGISAAGNFVAGTIQTVGAVTGQTTTTEEGAEAVATITSASGVGTLIATGGNLNKAATAAAVEGIVTSSPSDLASGGNVARAAKAIDLAQNIHKVEQAIKDWF